MDARFNLGVGGWGGDQISELRSCKAKQIYIYLFKANHGSIESREHVVYLPSRHLHNIYLNNTKFNAHE